METLPNELINIIIGPDIKNYRTLNKNFLAIINKSFYKKYIFNASRVKYNFDLIENIQHVTSCKKLSKFSKVKILIFFYDFIYTIKRQIPNTVTHLTFSTKFNRSVKDSIPNSVTHLTFGDKFNCSIKDSIPNSVTHLTFGHNFNYDIKDSIPNSVGHSSNIRW